MDWDSIKAKLARLWKVGTYTGDGHVCEAIALPRKKRPSIFFCGDCGRDM